MNGKLKKAIAVIIVAGVATVVAGLLFGADPKETFLFILEQINAQL